MGYSKQNVYARTQSYVKLNNIVRAITWSSRYCPVTSLYKTLNFLKLHDIYKLEVAKFICQLHHKKFKTALNDCFVDITKIHSHNTRTKHNLVYFKPRVQTSIGKKSLTYRGSELWGKIDCLFLQSINHLLLNIAYTYFLSSNHFLGQIIDFFFFFVLLSL